MNAAVPRLSFSAESMARYCFMMPISSMRLVLAKTVVIGVLIFLAIWLAVNLLFSWMRVKKAIHEDLILIAQKIVPVVNKLNDVFGHYKALLKDADVEEEELG